MGVKELWPILDPVKKQKTFQEMRGETIAIDLSIWIVDSQHVKPMVGAVIKPHLRNLFFRTSAMLNSGILPVFVIEGAAPELKWQTMAERQNVRQGRGSHPKNRLTAKRTGRSHFKSVIKECCEMLDYLGVPFVYSSGEAEAMCAVLNQAGLVDAVITEDGDAFLYGAETVYRNFTTTKVPCVESYKIADIRSQLHLTRNHLIALALLVGCDYCPKGVPGVGKTHAMKLCEQLGSQDVLIKLQQWSASVFSGMETTIEKQIAEKISRMNESNFKQIINEFYNKLYKPPGTVGVWRKPLLSKAQDFNLSKLEWPINYSLEKMVPLLTLWSMKSVIEHTVLLSELTITPDHIVKKRTRQGISCLEILWRINDPYDIDEEDYKQPVLTTIEPVDMLEQCFPDLVQSYLMSKTVKPQKTGKSVTVNTVNKKFEDKLCVQDRHMKYSKSEQTKAKNNLTMAKKVLHLSPKVKQSTFDESDLPSLNDTPLTNEEENDVIVVSSDDESDDVSSTALCHTKDNKEAQSGVSRSMELGFSTTLNLTDSKHLDSQNKQQPVEYLVVNNSPTTYKPRTSVDNLLNDISKHLMSPCTSTLNSPNRQQSATTFSTSDKILAGYITPASLNNTVCRTYSINEDSSVSLLDLMSSNSDDNSNSSNISYEQDMKSPSKISPVQAVVELNTNSELQITLGDFDLVPQLSAFSFSE